MSVTIDVASREAVYRGIRDESGDRFVGIRYAEPPVGTLRVKAPVLHENRGTVDATRYGFAPPQHVRQAPAWAPQGDGFETGEDCLNLNVFTPVADGALRPVIVHAFGGGFQGGAAHGTFHHEASFARRGDVVLVRPNMRVGALGFLHLGDAYGADYAATNRGMLDFIAALRWVRDNIAAFGGDPDNVTLVGMSSGSFTISALFGVAGVAELYRRVWLMSGPASRIIARDTAAAFAADFLSRVGVDAGGREALEALRRRRCSPCIWANATRRAGEPSALSLMARACKGTRSMASQPGATRSIRSSLAGLRTRRACGTPSA
jgi:para-nitrobenzyl esterase